jgi:hypothetical protein
MARTPGEAIAIYNEAYRRRNGSIYEKVNNQLRLKKNVLAARRRLRSLYADQN